MRTVLMINGPLPPEGKEFCPVCVALYKNSAEALFKDAIQKGLKDYNTTEPLVLDLSAAELRDPEHQARMIWQLRRIDVR